MEGEHRHCLSFERPLHSVCAVPDGLAPGADPQPFLPLSSSPLLCAQCQMAKQTMGTPLQALTHRTDTKLYRLQVGGGEGGGEERMLKEEGGGQG